MVTSRPIHLNMVLSSPVRGEPRMPQATAATSGGTNSGIIAPEAIASGDLRTLTVQELDEKNRALEAENAALRARLEERRRALRSFKDPPRPYSKTRSSSAGSKSSPHIPPSVMKTSTSALLPLIGPMAMRKIWLPALS